MNTQAHGMNKQSMILAELHGPEEVVVQVFATTGKVARARGIRCTKMEACGTANLSESRSLRHEGEDG